MFTNTRSIASSIGLALLLSLTLLGCEDKQSNPIGTPDPSTNNPQGNDMSGDDMGTDANNDNNGHGGEEKDLIDVHPLHGQWNVVTDDTDETPVGIADLVLEIDATTGTGNFVTGVWFGSEASGEFDDFSSIEVTDSSMIVKFNTTNDAEQLYTLTASDKIDDDTIKGTLTDAGTLNQKIIVRRKIFPQ